MSSITTTATPYKTLEPGNRWRFDHLDHAADEECRAKYCYDEYLDECFLADQKAMYPDSYHEPHVPLYLRDPNESYGFYSDLHRNPWD